MFASVSNRVLYFVCSELMDLDPVLFLNVFEECHTRICLC